MSLLPVLVALAACSGSAPARVADTPVVTISAGEPVDQAPLQFHVRAQPAPATDLTVSVTIAADGCDVTQSPESATILAGDHQAVFTVLTSSLEAGAGGGCTVTAAIAAGDGYQVGAVASASATVMPEPVMPVDQPVVTIAAGASPVAEGATASWTLSAAPAPTTVLTVNLTWTQSGDFLPGTRPQTVTIPVAGTATVSVDTVDDSTDEPNGSVTLRVAVGSGYTVGASSTATVTVSDDDSAVSRVATLHVTRTQVTEGENITFQIRATRAFDNNGIIKVRFDDSGLGYHFIVDHVLFAGTTSRDLFRTVPEIAGNQAGRTVRLRILVHTGYTVGSPGSATITVVDSGT